MIKFLYLILAVLIMTVSAVAYAQNAATELTGGISIQSQIDTIVSE